MSKINIFHMAPYPYYAGGIDSWLDNFVRSLLDDGFDVNLFCFDAEDIMDRKMVFEAIESEKLRIHYLPSLEGLLSAPLWLMRYMWALRRTKLYPEVSDRSIVLSTLPILPVILLSRIFGLIKGELICSVRGQIAQDCLDLGKPKLLSLAVKLVEGISLRLSDLVVANGQDTANYLLRFYSIPSRVSPNGVSNRFFDRVEVDPELRTLSDFSGKTIFLHVGTLRPVKGIHFILKAYSLLTKVERERSLLVFIGKGMIEDYQKQADELDINVMFLGHKNNVVQFLQKVDFVINVSGGSGVSNSLIEALMLGKPVIAWDKPTFSQVLGDNNGILCKEGDASSLSQALRDSIEGKMVFSREEIISSVNCFRWDSVYREWRIILGNTH
ncbi:glycosyltransferase [Pseudomonadales bacterium]|nr:glycosyltransferase [Pseudomonadales bacterium]